MASISSPRGPSAFPSSLLSRLSIISLLTIGACQPTSVQQEVKTPHSSEPIQDSSQPNLRDDLLSYLEDTETFCYVGSIDKPDLFVLSDNEISVGTNCNKGRHFYNNGEISIEAEQGLFRLPFEEEVFALPREGNVAIFMVEDGKISKLQILPAEEDGYSLEEVVAKWHLTPTNLNQKLDFYQF